MPVSADIQTNSAGIRALAGYPMDAAAASVLAELGGDPRGHVAQQLTPDLVGQADLILTATTAQRAEIIAAQPTVLRRTFALREFVRLGRGLPERATATLRERVADVAAQRGLVPPEEAGDEIADPFGAAMPVVRQSGRQLSEAIDGLLGILLPADRGACPPQ